MWCGDADTIVRIALPGVLPRAATDFNIAREKLVAPVHTLSGVHLLQTK
jgi:hypothetical protein